MEIECLRRAGSPVTVEIKELTKPAFEQKLLDPIDIKSKHEILTLIKCCGCDEPYNECDKVPKSLECGHALCNECVNKSTTLVGQCPECLSLYNVADTKNFPIDYPVLRIIRADSKVKTSLNDIGTKVISSLSLLSDLEDDSWRCPAHGSPTAFLCVSCSTWACRDCLVVDHPHLPRGSCRILSLAKAIERIKKNHRKKSYATLQKIDLIKNIMEPEVNHISFLVKHCPSSEKSHSRIQNIIDRRMDKLKEEEESLTIASIALIEKTRKAVKKTTSPKELSTLGKKLADCQQKLQDYIAQGKDRKKILKQEISLHLRMDLKLLIEGGERLYAVCREGSLRIRWAQISYMNNRLFVSSLREGHPPEPGLIVQHEFVRDMVPKNKPTIFFDIGTTDISHGIVCIRLCQDCPRVRNLLSLCSGGKDICYKGSSLYKMEYNKESIYGGDLENNDGTGSNDSLDHSENDCPEEKCIYSHGYYLTSMYCSFSKFGFERRTGTSRDVMGRVTKGSEVIKSLCDKETVSGIIIRECGFLIPRELDNYEVLE